MRRGFTVVELIIGLVLMVMIVLGTFTLMVSTLTSLRRTDTDVTMTDQNSRALRRVTERVREAAAASILDNGRTMRFNLPAKSALPDPVTGEIEYKIPAISDGVNRGYTVDFTAGTLKDIETGRVLVRDIYDKDPDPTSTLYNKTYAPFELGYVGAKQAVTINLITRVVVGTQVRTMRMKTTAILRNVQ